MISPLVDQKGLQTEYFLLLLPLLKFQCSSQIKFIDSDTSSLLLIKVLCNRYYYLLLFQYKHIFYLAKEVSSKFVKRMPQNLFCDTPLYILKNIPSKGYIYHSIVPIAIKLKDKHSPPLAESKFHFRQHLSILDTYRFLPIKYKISPPPPDFRKVKTFPHNFPDASTLCSLHQKSYQFKYLMG